MKDDQGEFVGRVISAQDLTLVIEHRKLSVTDGPRGIWNHRKLDNVIEYEFNQSKRGGRLFALILFDIDDCKKVNDTYGHPEGDRVLVSMAAIAGSRLRESDTFGRFGGEEFLIVLPDIGCSEAGMIAEELRRWIEEADFKLELPVPASFGISVFSPDDGEPQAFLKRADQALYEAKKSAKQRISTG